MNSYTLNIKPKSYTWEPVVENDTELFSYIDFTQKVISRQR